MPHSEAWFSSSPVGELTSGAESVFVTHVESPVLFFCRQLAYEDIFKALQEMIDTHVDLMKAEAPDGNPISGPDQCVLIFSLIRNRWCRGRILSYQRNADFKPINAKVCLIDFGSIEIVLWNEKYVRSSNAKTATFNDGRGFCFPCALQLRPYNEGKPNSQWSSYATFLIEKETKSRPFLLCPVQSNTLSRDIVTCDLVPISGIHPAENQTLLSQTNFTSLSSFLINANVARCIDRLGNQAGDEANQEHSDDDGEKENLFITNNC